jgi:hypothetical protein
MTRKLTILISMLVIIGTIAMGQKIDTIKIAIKDQNLSNKAHRDRDVVISFFETEHNNKDLYCYAVTIYRIVDGNLKDYSMATALKKNEKNVFDKAVFKWEDDSAIVFKLINSNGNCSETYKMIGSITKTSLGVHSKEL